MADTGKEVGALLEMPHRSFDHDFYLQAYNHLQTERGIGMALGPIPWTAIIKYAEHYRVGDCDLFVAVIEALDTELRSQSDKDEKKPVDKDQPKARPTPEELASQMAAAGKFGR